MEHFDTQCWFYQKVSVSNSARSKSLPLYALGTNLTHWIAQEKISLWLVVTLHDSHKNKFPFKS